MDILKRIKKLQNEKNCSVCKLESEANLPQSTIANMFTRKTLPSITTLNQIVKLLEFFFQSFFLKNKKIITKKNFY